MIDLKSIQSFLSPFQNKWKDTESLTDKELLRLFILKQLSSKIHAERSIRLATKKTRLQTLLEVDEILKNFQIHLSAYTLDECLLSAGEHTPAKHEVSDFLTKALGEDLIHRYDFLWEKRIISKAEKSNWEFYQTHSKHPAKEVEKRYESLINLLWPNALVITTKTKQLENSIWQGSFIITAHPEFDPPLDPTDQFVKIGT